LHFAPKLLTNSLIVGRDGSLTSCTLHQNYLRTH